MNYFNDISFGNPGFLWLSLLIPLLILWYIWKRKKHSGEIRMSTVGSFKNIRASFKVYAFHMLYGLRMLAILLLIVVLARPQSRSSWKNVTTEGIDIVLCMDISASMLAQDFRPTRLDASKEVAIEFVDSRPTDRIGLVIFSGESFTLCPLTTDHSVVKNQLASVKTGMVADGTAIGMGLATAVTRIKDSKAKSKVIILLTDGVNNAGSVAPLTAAEIAKVFGLRVYTIGVGTRGKALSPVAVYPNGQYEYDYVNVEIDEAMMTEIASMTSGKYFRATDKNKLKNVYQEIDRLEKTIIEEKSFTEKEERFLPFAVAAGLLLLLEFLLRNTVFRALP